MQQGITVLTLPGWLGSGEGHWQTRWEQLYGAQRVQQHDWEQPLRGDWVAALEEHMLNVAEQAKTKTPRFAVAAHSLGCHLLAAWASHSQHAHWVAAALLVAPPNLAQANTPPAVARWQPASTKALPFRAVVWGSDNDPFSSWASIQTLAGHWGAAAQCMTGAGHINADSGLGDWPDGWRRLQQLLE